MDGTLTLEPDLSYASGCGYCVCLKFPTSGEPTFPPATSCEPDGERRVGFYVLVGRAAPISGKRFHFRRMGGASLCGISGSSTDYVGNVAWFAFRSQPCAAHPPVQVWAGGSPACFVIDCNCAAHHGHRK